MSDNHYAPARVADNAGRAQVIGARFVPDYTLTPTASSVWSAWNTGFTVSGDWLALGAYVKILGASAATLTAFIQHQLATGAAGSEVPFATFGDSFSFLITGADTQYVDYTRIFLFPPILLPNGTVIRQRATISSAGASGRLIWNLFGIPVPFYQRPHPLHRPDAYMRGRTALGPSAAMADAMEWPTPLTYTTAATANAAFGAWATVATAANQTMPLLVTGLKCMEATVGDLLNRAILAEIGIGEAAAAVGIEEVKFPNVSPFALPGGYMPLRRPIYIPAGSGLSVRAGSTAVKNVLFQISSVALK